MSDERMLAYYDWVDAQEVNRRVKAYIGTHPDKMVRRFALTRAMTQEEALARAMEALSVRNK